jgi:acyl carrier protein
MDMKSIIRKYIREEIGSRENFSDDESLYDNGILDSLKMIQFMLFLQSQFDIVMDPSLMTVEDFETVDRIEAFVQNSKKAGSANV